jgi:alkanesulfonate monooxygenase SsuD/methylene tetrahydromethanopterin reductase-like flavin-dependent oxidoreductase (luciferase family)
MLDEGLGVLRAVWSGEPQNHTGTHYHVHLEATESQRHPIPIWIASSTRHPLVIRRAASCDGIFPISDHTLTPQEVADIVEALRHAGVQADQRYDVVISGNASSAWERPNPDGVDLAAMADAGATWWMESLIHFDPLALSLQIVDAGPP